MLHIELYKMYSSLNISTVNKSIRKMWGGIKHTRGNTNYT
jgi:hypothetical protein